MMLRILAYAFAVQVATYAAAQPNVVEVNPFPNGAERSVFYTTHEGGGVIPTMWYWNMYVTDSVTKETTKQPFSELMDRYGFITNSPEPGGYPIGLTQGRLDHLFRANVVGLNCAACHTREFDVTTNGKTTTYRINGAPGLADVRKFALDVVESAKWTLSGPVPFMKMIRRSKAPRLESLDFFEKVLHFDDSADEAESTESSPFYDAVDEILKRERDFVDTEFESNGFQFLLEGDSDVEILQSDPVWFETLFDETKQRLSDNLDHSGLQFESLNADGGDAHANALLNVAEIARMFWKQLKFLEHFTDLEIATREGAGRLEAFGSVRGLLFPKETKAAKIKLNAPASVPYLWGLAEHELLHWNSNSNAVLQRNIAQALGVGALALPDGATNVNLFNLNELETRAMMIAPPKWDVAFGPVDTTSATFTRGKALFEQHCKSCHVDQAVKLPNGLYRYYDMPLSEIKTDPGYAKSFSAGVGNEPFYAKIENASDRIEEWYFKKHAIDAATQKAWRGGDARLPVVWRDPLEKDPHAGAYPARRLVGTWATAPYLHNNSVPTMRDLLRPANKRPSKFLFDRRAYDSKNMGVGYKAFTSQHPPTKEEKLSSTYLDTTIDGNRNTGHEYGTNLPDDDAYALVEYIKSL